MKIEIKNRWTGNVQFECELSAEVAGQSYGLRLGFAVRKARETGAVLTGAVLTGADLTGAVLRSAVLTGADLRSADLTGAVLTGADLRSAVLTGADLRSADLTGAVLTGADLRSAVLTGAVLRSADLRSAVLTGADLRSADLTGADLRSADLTGAVLTGAVLTGADWMPRIPNIHQAVYEAASKPAALDMSQWHTTNACGTTHCRAGWVIALAGEGGRVLEGAWGTPAAAAAIYMASDPTLERVPDFYANNTVALADMERLAKAEAARADVA